MKVLVATSQTQGQRASDFNWCIEGEVVTFSSLCDRDRIEGPDGGCGCGRGFAGLNSHKATTTAVVRDIDGYTLDDLTEAVRSFRQQAGWAGLAGAKAEQRVAAEVEELAEMAGAWPAGTVIERRLDDVQPRETRPSH
jgi:hypothetical protein